MKIAPLLAEFLLLHKRLDLPGIGRFLLDTPGLPGHEFSGTRFEADTRITGSAELVNFIAENTGKQKALAAADLDSHLETVRQFLNIGKPFQFEGIGSLTRLQTGQYSFTPGEAQMEKAGGKSIKENIDEGGEENAGGFKSIFYTRRVKTDSRKTLFILLLIIGLGLAIWGGYTMYKRTTDNKEMNADSEPEKTANENNVPVNAALDTSLQQADSTAVSSIIQPPPIISIPGQYKFVVEAAEKARGLKRYGLLKGFGLPVKMETRDSVLFKIYFLLPATAADTARLRDSLQRLYSPIGVKAFVEN